MIRFGPDHLARARISLLLDDLLGWLAGSVLEAVIESPVELLEMICDSCRGSAPLEAINDQPGSILRLW
jgi:ABC-type histidine transport system ATPase subunit